MKRLILVLALLCPVSLLADFQAGVDAFERDDYATAYREFLPVAEQGDAVAQFNLGVMHENGNGVPQDYAKAEKWYRLAAEQGDASAQSNLGVMYDNGLGVPQNYAEAVKWYRLAAEQGFAIARYNLGLMYLDGEGGPQDYVRAYAWWILAAAQGDKGAVEGRDVLQKELSPAQVAEGQKLSKELFERVKEKE